MRLLVLLVLLSKAPCVTGGWTFAGQDNWAATYPDCGKNRQSPINIVTEETVHDEDLDSGFRFARSMGQKLESVTFKNDGKSYKAEDNNYDTSSLEITGADLPAYVHDFTFWQFHYHWGTASQPGSEHTINGKRYPAEVHFVFKGQGLDAYDKQALAVLGFLIDINDDNDNYKHGGSFGHVLEVINDTLTAYESTADLSGQISISELIPIYYPQFVSHFYHYDGSLTTPPCYETVNWYVFAEPLYVSQAQYDVFVTGLDASGGPMTNTFRRTQPLNGRTVYRASMGMEDEDFASSLVAPIYLLFPSLVARVLSF